MCILEVRLEAICRRLLESESTLGKEEEKGSCSRWALIQSLCETRMSCKIGNEETGMMGGKIRL